MTAEPDHPEMDSSEVAVAAAYERMARSPVAGVLIEVVDEGAALAAARRVDATRATGTPQPLAGRTAVVKANIDVAGHRTTAGCPAFGEVAAASAPVVQALEAAGAVVVGIANMDQFATGLVGTRSPYGACPNARWPDLVSGGSSSGSAVAVALGWVDVGVGTDTAGSGRVPAALNGIVGLKPTRGRLSARGVVPACRSYDCVSVFAATVGEAARATELAAGFDAADPWSRHATLPPPRDADRPLRVGVPRGVTVPGLDVVANGAGAELIDIDLDPFLEAGALLYGGAFVAERYAAVGEFIAAHRADVDPVVAEIILAGASVPAWALVRDLERLAQLQRATEPTWSSIDVLAVPSVPHLPTIAEVRAEPIARNTELGTYTTFVNLLDLCALTVPVGEVTVEAPPPSLTLIAPAWHDDLLVDVSRAI